MPAIVLLDNTVLTNYALVNRLDIFTALWKENVYAPQEVVLEYNAGIQGARVPEGAVEHLKIVHLTAEEQEYAKGFSTRLGAGERACLAACFFRQGVFSSEDRDARMQAQHLKIPAIGTVGILVLCVHRNLLEPGEAQDLLDRMIADGYRSPVVLIKELLSR
jgi:predicted nucleic acid-binding protein